MNFVCDHFLKITLKKNLKGKSLQSQNKSDYFSEKRSNISIFLKKLYKENVIRIL